MVLAAIVLVPLLVDRMRTIESDRAERINGANQQVLALARQGVAAQRDTVIAARAFLQVAARAHATFATTPESCNRFLADIAAQASWMTFSLADAGGRIICSSRAEAIGLDISDRPYFQEAMRSGQFVVSDYAIGRLNPAPMAVALFPQRGGSGSIEAVLIGVLDSAWITRLAGAAAERPRSAVLIVNGAGTVLTHHPDPDRWSGREFNEHPLVRAMLGHPEGVAIATGLDGIRRVFGFVQLPGTETRLAIGLDEGAIVQGVDREMRYAYLQLAAIAALLLLAIWIGGNRFIVRPIRLLALLAERFGHGEYEMHTARRRWAAEFVPPCHRPRRHGHEHPRPPRRSAHHDRAPQRARHQGRAVRPCQSSCVRCRSGSGVEAGAAARRAGGPGDDRCRSLQAVQRPLRPCRRRCLSARLGGDSGRHGENGSRPGGPLRRRRVRALLPGMELPAARKLMEQLRKAVEDRRLPHIVSPCGYVTVSIGVASLRPILGENAQVLVKAADAALYDAKRHGRNAVLAYEPMNVLLAS